jgi:cob(I)alamin adenosyltransferase
MTKKRLTGKYLEGTGDSGFSLLSSIEGRVSKGSFYTTLFSTLDELQHSLSNFLEFNPELVEEKDRQFFEYLKQLSFSINALIYSGFEDDPKTPLCPNWCEKQLPGSDGYDFMAERIDYFKEQCASLRGLEVGEMGSEFVVPSSYLNKLRLKTRRLESGLWGFRDDRRDFFAKKIQEELLLIDKNSKDMSSVIELVNTWALVRSRIQVLGTFLNRLSSYFFWAMCWQLLQKGGNLEEWRSEAPKLADFIKTEEET